MAYKICMFILALSGDFSTDLAQALFAIWCFSVGYLLWKKFNRRFRGNAEEAPSVLVELVDASSQALLRS